MSTIPQSCFALHRHLTFLPLMVVPAHRLYFALASASKPIGAATANANANPKTTSHRVMLTSSTWPRNSPQGLYLRWRANPPGHGSFCGSCGQRATLRCNSRLGSGYCTWAFARRRLGGSGCWRRRRLRNRPRRDRTGLGSARRQASLLRLGRRRPARQPGRAAPVDAEPCVVRQQTVLQLGPERARGDVLDEHLVGGVSRNASTVATAMAAE